MKAIRIESHGGPEVLQFRDVDPPKPGPGEVRVRLRAAGLNFVDIYQRRGEYPAPLPHTPGSEGAGVVEDVGEDVSGFKPGDRVAYSGHLGAYAEASVVPADSLIPLPESVSFEQGAAFPLQGMTAHYLLHEYRALKPGDVVLIHAAAGGMGLLLTQWAARLGARVIGTVSSEEKARTAREAGADEVILYTERDFVEETKRITGGHGADLVIDGVGKATFAGNLEAVAAHGHVVIYGYAGGPPDPIQPLSLMSRSVTVAGGMLPHFLRSRGELLTRANSVLQGMREGWLRLRIAETFTLKNAPEAQRRLESRESIGKIVLKIEN
ncbi:MAG TPA: quinone oxidoreductase [Blastocatellia bacterium]|nr:quinone oxidoreductase [Blastocatellia bacterium]